MTDPRDRDDSMDRLLQQTLRQPAATAAEASPACLDAETIGAWMDGGLSGSALAAAEAHASACARCGAIVAAMVLTEEPAAATSAERRWWPWLVPVAAAAIVIIAVALPGRQSTEFESAAARVEEEAASPVLRQVQPEKPAARAAAPAEASRKDAQRKQETPRAKAVAAPSAAAATAADRAAAPTAAPAAPPATQALGAARALESVTSRIGPFEIQTPRADVRWRVTGGVVARTVDSGATWQNVPTGLTAELTAGAAPSADVCWLVGRGGLVMLTTDGRTWRRLAFSEATDLSTVVAGDARSATVTAVDGRAWVTSDAGITWVRRPLQGISPAPFYE